MSHSNASADAHSVGQRPDWTVNRVAATGSTNQDLLTAAADGAPDRSVLMADFQTAGRGRLDRTWDAPPGANLLVSVLFRRGFDATNPHVLTRAVALAAVHASKELTGQVPDLKWPNDLLLDGRKLGGILAQAGTTEGRLHVVVGLGLNLGWAPNETARLVGVSPYDFLPVWLRHLGLLLDTDTDTATEYRARLATLGQSVRVERGSDTLTGIAVDVQPDGALIVDTGTDRVVVTIGDVVHLRTGEADSSE